MFQTKVLEKIKIHVLSSVTFFQNIKQCSSWDNVEKYGRIRQATNHNTTRRRQDAIRMPDNKDKTTHTQTHTLSFNTYYCQQQYEICGSTREKRESTVAFPSQQLTFSSC